MFDGFWSGIIGDFVAPYIFPVLRRFKYTTIFFAGIIGSYVLVFVAGVWVVGSEATLRAMLEIAPTPFGILVAMGCGAFWTFAVWVHSSGLQGKASDKGGGGDGRSD